MLLILFTSELRHRLLLSLAMVVVFFTATLSLAKVNTDSWQQEFLAVTLSIIVLINVFSATFQGGVFGLAGSFPPQYMNALLSGQVGATNLRISILIALHNRELEG